MASIDPLERELATGMPVNARVFPRISPAVHTRFTQRYRATRAVVVALRSRA
jgi:hypothetical protein